MTYEQSNNPEADELLRLSDLAGGLATMARGKRRRELERASSHYLKMAFDAKYGELPTNIDEIDEQKLLADLFN